MKHENHTGTSRPALAVKTFLSGIAAVALLGFAVNAQAQPNCSVGAGEQGRWAAATGLVDGDTGTQGSNNRRYGGPCGLRVAVDGEERYLTDDSPLTELQYIVRFYAFLNNAGDDPVLIFAADDGDDDVIQVWYNVDENLADSPGDLTLNVVDSGDSNNTLSFEGIGNGWHSIELVWESSDSADIRFAVNTTEDDDLDLTFPSAIDTSGITVMNAHLGNILGAGTGGSGLSMDFDDFDSRRISRPGRLLVGDANGDGQINFFDLFAVNNELAPGDNFAAGQPDCTESGEVNFFDLFCINNLL